LGMLTQLLRHGTVSYQGGFCNLATGRLTPLPIRVPTACPNRIELLRGVKARVLEQLEPAIADALSAITAHNARAFFRHCGYGIQQL